MVFDHIPNTQGWNLSVVILISNLQSKWIAGNSQLGLEFFYKYGIFGKWWKKTCGLSQRNVVSIIQLLMNHLVVIIQLGNCVTKVLMPNLYLRIYVLIKTKTGNLMKQDFIFQVFYSYIVWNAVFTCLD